MRDFFDGTTHYQVYVNRGSPDVSDFVVLDTYLTYEEAVQAIYQWAATTGIHIEGESDWNPYKPKNFVETRFRFCEKGNIYLAARIEYLKPPDEVPFPLTT